MFCLVRKLICASPLLSALCRRLVRSSLGLVCLTRLFADSVAKWRRQSPPHVAPV